MQSLYYLLPIAVITAIGLWCLGIRTGRTRERFDREIAAYSGQIEQNKAQGPRHARPATSPARPPRPSPAAPGRLNRDSAGSWVRHAGAPGSPVPTAATIAPVALPGPGTPQAAPAKHGAAHTGTLPRARRVTLTTGSTGELTAVTDMWIAENCPEVMAAL